MAVIGEDGVVESVCEQNVFGTIKDLAVIPQSNKPYSNSFQVCIFHSQEFISVIRNFF